MDLIHNLALGFGVAFTFTNLLYAFFGAVLGTLIGVLPGLGPVATIAMLLPSIYALDATPALIMLAGIYYGAQYGGSTTASLIHVPGQSGSAAPGIGFVGIAKGVFGFGEIISSLGMPAEHREVFTKEVKGLWPTRQDFHDAWPAVLRGTALGSLLGVLPGGGALLASFASYTLEKKSKGRRGEVQFGKGNIRGVAGPESANNAGAQTSFIPMLTLGIPPNAVMALMVGAMTIKGIQPGPQVMTSNPQLFWGLIASMWVGNLMLVVLNLPMIGIWIKLLTVPYRFLFPAIVVFCCIGTYTLNNSSFDVYM